MVSHYINSHKCARRGLNHTPLLISQNYQWKYSLIRSMVFHHINSHFPTTIIQNPTAYKQQQCISITTINPHIQFINLDNNSTISYFNASHAHIRTHTHIYIISNNNQQSTNNYAKGIITRLLTSILTKSSKDL